MYHIYLYLGWTSLIGAAFFKQTDTVKILLEYGAHVNAKNNWG